MAAPFVSVRDPAVYENLRKAYVQAENQPTYAELSEQTGVPVGTIGRQASEESWVELRAAWLQKKDAESDALGLIVQAANRVDQRVMKSFADVVLIGLQKLSFALSQIPEDQASSTMCQTINTASFAFKNFADGCKAVGIISFGKELAALGKEDNGRWNPQRLSQINLTVQNLVSQAGGKTPGDLPLTKVEPTAPKAEKLTDDQAVT